MNKILVFLYAELLKNRAIVSEKRFGYCVDGQCSEEYTLISRSGGLSGITTTIDIRIYPLTGEVAGDMTQTRNPPIRDMNGNYYW